MNKVNIKYKIQFHTDWHCGSGLAAGADVDELVVKDEKGMPFIPGKTIKGLVREAVEEILFISKNIDDKREFFKQTFGNSSDRNIIQKTDENKPKNENEDYKDMYKGDAFFTNATLSADETKAITDNDAVRFMYRSIANTAIDEAGIADEHSLRKMEVVVPCCCFGEILDIPEAFENEICNALKYIKRLGMGRNRGLGRCTITVSEKGGKK